MPPGAKQLVEASGRLHRELHLDRLIWLAIGAEADQIGAVMAAMREPRGEMTIAGGTLAGEDLALGEDVCTSAFELGRKLGDHGVMAYRARGYSRCAKFTAAARPQAGWGAERQRPGSTVGPDDADQLSLAQPRLAADRGCTAGARPAGDGAAGDDAEASDEVEDVDVAGTYVIASLPTWHGS